MEPVPSRNVPLPIASRPQRLLQHCFSCVDPDEDSCSPPYHVQRPVRFCNSPYCPNRGVPLPPWDPRAPDLDILSLPPSYNSVVPRHRRILPLTPSAPRSPLHIARMLPTPPPPPLLPRSVPRPMLPERHSPPRYTPRIQNNDRPLLPPRQPVVSARHPDLTWPAYPRRGAQLPGPAMPQNHSPRQNQEAQQAWVIFQTDASELFPLLERQLRASVPAEPECIYAEILHPPEVPMEYGQFSPQLEVSSDEYI